MEDGVLYALEIQGLNLEDTEFSNALYHTVR